MFDGLMDYKTIINLLLENNKALKDDNERFRDEVDSVVEARDGARALAESMRCCGNCNEWHGGIGVCHVKGGQQHELCKHWKLYKAPKEENERLNDIIQDKMYTKDEIDSVVEARDEAREKMKRYREEVVWLQKAMADQSEKQPSKRCGNCAVWYHKKGRCNLGGGEPCKYWELYKP